MFPVRTWAFRTRPMPRPDGGHDPTGRAPRPRARIGGDAAQIRLAPAFRRRRVMPVAFITANITEISLNSPIPQSKPTERDAGPGIGCGRVAHAAVAPVTPTRNLPPGRRRLRLRTSSHVGHTEADDPPREGIALGHYIANVRDLEFNLFEVLDVGAVLGAGDYRDLDEETVRTILGRSRPRWRKARSPNRSPSPTITRPSSTRPPHTISVPPELAKTVQAIKTAGWWRLGVAEEIGGMPAPRPLAWAVNEMIICANPAANFFYSLGPVDGAGALRRGQRTAAAVGGGGRGARLAGHHGAHRARRGFRRRGRSPRPSRNPMAPGTSRASSGSSPVATSATPPRTSSTSCWPGPRAPVRAPKG